MDDKDMLLAMTICALLGKSVAPQMVDNKYREAMNLLAGYRKYTNESNRTGHD